MTSKFAHLAETYAKRILKEPVTSATRFALLFTVADDKGNVLPVVRIDLTPTIKIQPHRDTTGKPDMQEAKATAESWFRNGVAGPVRNWLTMDENVVIALIKHQEPTLGNISAIKAVDLEISDKA